MPNNLRGEIKRKIDGLIDRLQKTQGELMELAVLYRDQHPDIGSGFFAVADSIDVIIDPLKLLRDKI
jgi:hypothetical protein